ncbi:MAG: NADH-quinone oxidoreductase subunit N [Methanomassiliicoccales archaeon]|nr:MAG: NADH-quinone oxidoreductase subunit N [Methanomassiliicoccales archaeon]
MVDYTAITPEIVLAMFAIALPALGMVTRSSKVLGAFSLVGIALAGFSIWSITDGYSLPVGFQGFVLLEDFAVIFMYVFLAVAFYVILASITYVDGDRHKPEYYSLILLATVGMLFVACATDLFALFIGIELTSLSSYALVSFRKKDVKSAEAATKYFIIGAMSSGFALFGISLVYGYAGTTRFDGINYYLITQGTENIEIMWVAMIMTVVGFGFKISMVPFHMWAPDVYEGAPTTITAMLAAGSKKMGFVAMFKFFLIGIIAIKADWELLMAIMAVATMTVGNLAALNQTNIKRMLAYSSIAQAGYILMAIPVATDYALAGGLFQIVTHAFMKGGAFMIVATLGVVAVGESINDYKGLAKRSPLMAISMTIFLLSLAGIPPLAGFASKFFLFSAPIDAVTSGNDWLLWLTVAAIINSAISLFYYVRIIKYMLVEKGENQEKLKLPSTMVAAVLICVTAVVVMGIFPGPFFEACQNAASSFFAFLS